MNRDPVIDQTRCGYALAGALALVCGLAVTACGSAAPRTTTRASVAIDAPCQQVAAVLSDGPDPDADPVGHAQAQILPLRALHVTGQPLHRDIQSLAGAYQAYAAAQGRNATTRRAAQRAVHQVNAACPAAGAAL
jgi:hypothetical protein